MKRSQEFGPKATIQGVARSWAFGFGCLVGGSLGYVGGVYVGARTVADLVSDSDGSRAALAARAGGAVAVPLGNTGTTTVGGAR